MTGKYWILAGMLLALTACADKPAEPAADDASPVPATAPATPAPEPEPVAAPVATDAALQVSDVDAYLRGIEKEVQLLRAEYAKIEQARADDDSAAETAALFAMTANAIDEAGAQAAALPQARYDYIKERVDEIQSRLAMLEAGDPYTGIDAPVAEAFEANKGRIQALRGEAIGLRLKAAGG